MNNLGGYKTVELIFIDELSSFAATGSGAYIKKWSDIPKRLLPMHQEGADIDTTAKNENAGALYTHKADITLIDRLLTRQLRTELEHVATRGCILLATTYNNETHVFGNSSYPMLGNFLPVHGKKRSDLACHRLTLSATCDHPDLPLCL